MLRKAPITSTAESKKNSGQVLDKTTVYQIIYI